MTILKIFLLFCYYGCLCFGGGNSLTPLYIEDLVNTRQWLTLDEFGNLSAIAQMTPGPIGINGATFIGFRQGGVLGGAAATIGLLLPSYFLVLLALHSLKRWEKSAVVQGIMSGMRPATVGMMIASMLIFMGMSVFSEELPWRSMLGVLGGSGGGIPAGFFLRPSALLIYAASAAVLYKGKVSVISVVFASAALGALICR